MIRLSPITWIEINLLRIIYYIIVKRVHIHTLHTPLACYPVLTAGSVVFYFFPTTKGAMRHLWGICQYLSISFFFSLFLVVPFISIVWMCVTSIFLFESVSACNASPYHSRFFIFLFSGGGLVEGYFSLFLFCSLFGHLIERERVRESSENANGIMDTLYYCCCPFYSFPQRVFQVADAFCPTPYPHFFSSSFLHFIYFLFIFWCLCVFLY